VRQMMFVAMDLEQKRRMFSAARGSVLGSVGMFSAARGSACRQPLSDLRQQLQEAEREAAFEAKTRKPDLSALAPCSRLFVVLECATRQARPKCTRAISAQKGPLLEARATGARC